MAPCSPARLPARLCSRRGGERRAQVVACVCGHRLGRHRGRSVPGGGGAALALLGGSAWAQGAVAFTFFFLPSCPSVCLPIPPQSYSFNYMGQKLGRHVRVLTFRALLRQVRRVRGLRCAWRRCHPTCSPALAPPPTPQPPLPPTPIPTSSSSLPDPHRRWDGTTKTATPLAYSPPSCRQTPWPSRASLETPWGCSLRHAGAGCAGWRGSGSAAALLCQCRLLPPPCNTRHTNPAKLPLAQNLVTFGGGIVIAFINGWKMTLVVLACLPLIMASAVIHTKVMIVSASKVRACVSVVGWAGSARPRWWVQSSARGEAWGSVKPLHAAAPALSHPPQEDETFAQANQTASEAFGNIRTIAAFAMEGQVRRAGCATPAAAPWALPRTVLSTPLISRRYPTRRMLPTHSHRSPSCTATS